MFLKLCLVLTALAAFETYAEPECPASDGKEPVYIPHEDCSKFWECSDGTLNLFNCSAGLHFNSKSKVCEWPHQAGCIGDKYDGNESDESSSDESSSSERKLVIIYKEKNGNGNVEVKRSGDIEVRNSGNIAVQQSGVPECPAKDENLVYIRHPDCSKFWQCSNGKAYLYDCPAGFQFNPDTNVCDLSNQTGCNDGNKVSKSIKNENGKQAKFMLGKNEEGNGFGVSNNESSEDSSERKLIIIYKE